MDPVSLTLGVVPILMTAASHYEKAYRSSRIALSQKTKDQDSANFYFHLHNELVLLHIILNKVLPDLSDAERIALARSDRKAWPANVDKALSQRLGSAKDGFIESLKDALRVLDKILSDKTTQLLQDDIDGTPSGIYAKLQLVRQKAGGKNDGLVNRIRYTSHQHKRNSSLKELRDLVKMLERLTGAAESYGLVDDSATTNTAKIDSRSRKLVHEAYDVIAETWSCNCPLPHKFKLCVNMWHDGFDDPSIVSLDTYISSANETPESVWQEGSLVIGPDSQVSQPPVRFEGETSSRRRRSSASLSTRKNVDSVCTLVEEAHQHGTTLDLMYDGRPPSPTLYQIPSRTSRHRTQDEQTVLTLHDLFRDGKKLSLRDKCILSVVLARSLLDFSDSKWIKNWDKENISFVVAVAGSIDCRRPCLTTDFSPESQGTRDGSASIHRLHPCTPLLQLAIMLLELQLEDTIERKRSEVDLVNGQVGENTNLWTAERLLEELVDDIRIDYKRAVSACLRCEYDAPPSFDDEDFRTLVYTTIVAPLENELYNGFLITTDELRIET